MIEQLIRYDIVSIVFTLVFLIAGIYGYNNNENVPLLVTVVIFTILLTFGIVLEGSSNNHYPLLITLIVLETIFVLWFGLMTILWLVPFRYYQPFRFMPSGPLALITLIVIVQLCQRLHIKRQRTAGELPVT